MRLRFNAEGGKSDIYIVSCSYLRGGKLDTGESKVRVYRTVGDGKK